MRISDWSSDVCSSDLAALDTVEEQAGGEQIGSAAGRGVHGNQLLVQRMQLATTAQARTATGVEHRSGAVLHGLQTRLAGAVEHAGVGQRRHDRQQGIERSEEHTSELQSLMRLSYAVFCLKKKK